MRNTYIRAAESFLVIYSISKKDSLKEAESILKRILEVQDKSTGQVPTVLVANKIDLDNERQVSFEEGKKIAETWKIPFFESSAKTSINVKEAFFELVRQIRIIQYHNNQNTNEKTPKKGGICTII